jgi:hypothetical protein
VNNPSDVGKNDHYCFKFGFALPCRALVNWGSSSAWIGTYFLGHIEKTLMHHKLLQSQKSLGHFQCFEECQHKCSFEFPFAEA